MNKLSLLLMVIVLPAVIILGVALIKGESPSFKMISVRSNHTYVYTSPMETFNVSVLINKPTTHHLLETAILHAAIHSEKTHTILPLDVVGIHFEGKKHYADAVYFMYDIELLITFHSEDLLLQYEEASLVFSYAEFPDFHIPIGSFSYLFAPENQPHLSVDTRYNIHENLSGLPTSVGIVIGLINHIEQRLLITDVTLHAMSVHADLANAIIYEGALSPHMNVTDILSKTYDHFGEVTSQEPVELPAQAEMFLFVPFIYRDDAQLLHRYPLTITYELNGYIYQYTVDDFLFISTDFYQVEHGSHVVIHDDYH